MAINLSRSFAKPCDILCDLTVDNVTISQLTVMAAPGGLLVLFGSQAPSIKYNGQGYTCQFLLVTTPSLHTIEDIRADAQVVANCVNPSGKIVTVSTLLRTNPGASRTKTFLSAFIPYLNTERNTDVKLQDWSLTQMIPPEPAYYTYQGAVPWGGDRQGIAQNVVFRTMANIDPTDFALLVKAFGSTPRKMATRSQEIFFNDTSHLPGVPDGKALMRCRRIKKKGGDAERITPVKGLEDASKNKESDMLSPAQQAAAKTGFLYYIVLPFMTAYYHLQEIGWGNVIDGVIYALALILGAYAAYKLSSSDRGLTLARTAHKGAVGLRGLIGTTAAKASVLASVAASKAGDVAKNTTTAQGPLT